MKETIEIGKRFIRRNYSVVKITETKGDHFCDEFGRWYFSNGTVVKDEESPYDLMSQIFEISTLNPNKIDEERMRECFEQVFTKDIYLKSHFKTIVDQYNSTLEDHQVLQPLPSEMPESFGYYYGNNVASDVWDKIIQHYGTPKSELQPLPKDKPDWFEWSLDTSKYDLWDELVKTYGTPTKKELVSVEELAKEIKNIYVPCSEEKKLSYVIAQHIIDTYSLNPPKRDEFPFNLKRGDLFMNGEFLREFKAIRISIVDIGNQIFSESDCTPYHEPSIHDKVKEKLGIELYEEFMKEVKGA